MNGKKILIIDASLRNGFSSEIVNKTEIALKDLFAVEKVKLKDYNINRCKGCCVCLSVGESKCPLVSDDVKDIFKKIESSDAVIFITPNYSLSIPGILKDLFDRLAYVFHRPRLFGKICLPIVVQGVYGGEKVAKYINEVMGFFGMKTVKGIVLSGGIYPNKKQKEEITIKNQKKLNTAIIKLIKNIKENKIQKPSLFKLMIFRMTRSSLKSFDESLLPDKEYYKENGWFESDYYYKVRIGIFKKIISNFFDKIIINMAKKK